MNPWLLAGIGFVLAFAGPLWAALHGSTERRFIAIQMCSAVAVLALVALTEAFGQPSSLDLALSLMLLSLPGTMLFALFLERWL